MSGAKKKQKVPAIQEAIAGGLGGMCGSTATAPLDLMKVRLQLHGELTKTAKKISVWSRVKTIYREEGAIAFFNGLGAALLRQAIYCTARFGIYSGGKDMYLHQFGKPAGVGAQSIIGMASGALSALMSSPADLVMIRMQADGNLPVNLRRNYKNCFEGIYRIAKLDGVSALWRGCGPNITRAIATTASQLVSYDQSKSWLFKRGFEDGLLTHTIASVFASAVGTVAANPLDVIRTRMMNTKAQQKIYTSQLDCAYKMLTKEGILSFYKGSTAYFVRACPYVVVMFIGFEQANNGLTALRVRYLEKPKPVEVAKPAVVEPKKQH